ncbi:unnamed protein product [Protopolystoma xenopodis]|uniref:Uncharacterized protein n=1 Tax=Protopolystoma xenopodis TaxID=117903 RepID=A0A3S5CM78_9PLAT|nr:unnamed protein product [Protopolystoma xenopodis]
MAKLTDDADYDAGETFENVPSPLANAGTHDNYYGRRLRTRCVLLRSPDNMTKLRQRGQPTSKKSFVFIEFRTAWLSPKLLSSRGNYRFDDI